jgi:hypothetical protein
VYYKQTVDCGHNILARKSEEGPLPYCRTGAESEGNNRPDSLVRTSAWNDFAEAFLSLSLRSFFPPWGRRDFFFYY